MTRKRSLLARSSNVATRQRVYRVDGALEIEEIDHFEIRRSRVLFEDVLAVTFHRYRGWLFPIIVGVTATFFVILAVVMGREDATAGWIMFGLTAAPLLLALLVRVIFGVDEINVFGKRSRAVLRFAVRKKRARRLFQEIVDEVRRVHGVPG